MLNGISCSLGQLVTINGNRAGRGSGRRERLVTSLPGKHKDSHKSIQDQISNKMSWRTFAWFLEFYAENVKASESLSVIY